MNWASEVEAKIHHKIHSFDTGSRLQRVRLQRAKNLVPNQHPIIDNNVKMFCYNEPQLLQAHFLALKSSL